MSRELESVRGFLLVGVFDRLKRSDNVAEFAGCLRKDEMNASNMLDA